jgi:hypothetical protein
VSEAATTRQPARSQAPVAPGHKPSNEHEVLGSINILEGLPDNAFDALPSGIPNAMFEDPSHLRKTALDRATPKPRDGYVQRWVRIRTVDGKPDVANKSEAIMNGWRPRRADTLLENERGLPIYDGGDGKGGVIVFKEELLLCEISAEFYEAMLRQMNAEQERINRVIYQETESGQGLPQKYARLGFDSGRSAADMID